METDFIDKLASAASTPGGGAASALCGALAAALAQMVANLTVGKKKYAAMEGEVRGALERLQKLQKQLEALVEADARAFLPVAQAMRLPATTPDEIIARSRAMQAALVEACEVPLGVMEKSLEVMADCEFLAHHGNALVIADAGASAACARAAIIGASYGIYANIDMMTDEAEIERFKARAEDLLTDGCDLADDICDYVAGRLGAPAVG